MTFRRFLIPLLLVALLLSACSRKALPDDPVERAKSLSSPTLVAQMRMTIQRTKNWEQRVLNEKACDALAATADLAERIRALPESDQAVVYGEYVPQGQALAIKLLLEDFESSAPRPAAPSASLPGQAAPLPGQAPARPRLPGQAP